MYAGGVGICINTHNYYYSLMYHPVSSAQQAAPRHIIVVNNLWSGFLLTVMMVMETPSYPSYTSSSAHLLRYWVARSMGFLCHSFWGFVSTHPKIIEQTKPWCQPSHLPCCTASVPHPSASPISVQQGPAQAPLMKIAGLEINRCQQYPTMISISEIQGVRRYYEPIGCSMAISYHIF